MPLANSCPTAHTLLWGQGPFLTLELSGGSEERLPGGSSSHGFDGEKEQSPTESLGSLGIGAMGWIKVRVSGGSHRASRTQDIRVYFHDLTCMSVSVPEVCVCVCV